MDRFIGRCEYQGIDGFMFMIIQSTIDDLLDFIFSIFLASQSKGRIPIKVAFVKQTPHLNWKMAYSYFKNRSESPDTFTAASNDLNG